MKTCVLILSLAILPSEMRVQRTNIVSSQDSKRIETLINSFENASRTENLHNLNTLISSNGIYVSSLERVLAPSDLGELFQTAAAMNTTSVWDERSKPTLTIKLIQNVSANVVFVHTCEEQATLLAPGSAVDFLLVKHSLWQVAAISRIGRRCSV